MSFVKIWVHLVFSTKNREPLIKKEFQQKLFDHIIENCKAKDIYLQIIGGYTEHIHCLISLNNDQSISKIAQLIKGESAYWINSNRLTEHKFGWQDDYFAISVSESQVTAVINYIRNQDKHHAKKSFADEVNLFMIRYRWNTMISESKEY